YRPALAHAQQRVERGATVGEVVFAVRLEPADVRGGAQHLAVVGGAQADAAAGGRRRVPTRRSAAAGRCGPALRWNPGQMGRGASSLPPICSQLPFGTLTHSAGSLSVVARPAQAWLAVWQSFLPASATP